MMNPPPCLGKTPLVMTLLAELHALHALHLAVDGQCWMGNAG